MSTKQSQYAAFYLTDLGGAFKYCLQTLPPLPLIVCRYEVFATQLLKELRTSYEANKAENSSETGVCGCVGVGVVWVWVWVWLHDCGCGGVWG